MSIWMIMYVLASLGAFGFMGLKLFPIYSESAKIDHAMEALVKDPGTARSSKKQIMESLFKRLDIDYVTVIGWRERKDHVFIDKKDDKVKIDIIYRAETPFFHNVLLVGDFKKSVSN